MIVMIIQLLLLPYDNMTKLEGKYSGSETTLRALAQGVSNASGVALADSGSISDTTITPLAKGEYTCREVIGICSWMYVWKCCSR